MDIKYLTVEHLSTKDLIRIFSKIVIIEELHHDNIPCWIWSGNRTRDCGYGHVGFKPRTQKIHRLMFAWTTHSIPIGREHGEIDHLCKRTACCNPVHLEFVDARTNVLRSNNPPSLNAKKTHCIHGHPLSGDNLFYDQGKRQCRICKRAAEARRIANFPDAAKEAQRRYRETHKEEIRQKTIANRDLINARARANYHARKLSKNS